MSLGPERRGEGERSFAAAWAVVDELVRFGMEHACVSPGSRSTPLALALRRHQGVRVHVHLDERASTFFALGIAKATRRPVAVGCTSGTAAAELFPAVVEAWASRAMLFLLTADRPPELRGVGANQTIDQRGLYGGYVRASIELPLAGGPPDPAAWRAPIEAAALAAVGPPPGPVQINAPFREPLVPEPLVPEPLVPRTLVPEPLRPPPSSRPRPEPEIVEGPDAEEVEALRRELSTERGVLLAGTMRGAPAHLVEIAARVGWPLVAEPTSNVRIPGALSAGQFLLSSEAFAGEHEPDVVVQFGAAPTSRAGLELVARAGRLVIVDPDHIVADPHRRAAWSMRAEACTVALEVLHGLPSAGETAWLRDWLAADAMARRAVDETVDAWDEPYEGRVARDVAACLPDGSTLVVGSSMPVRDLDAYMRPRTGVRVLGNRGASGIDGFVSTALGVAASGTPTTALCGDLTLLHDVGSLLWCARRGYDAVFVVVNNGGGVIFSFLPQKDLPELEELFTTPHGLDLGAICSAAGAGHARIERASALIPSLERARSAGGVQVVEVVVDAELNVRRHADVLGAVERALRPQG